MFQLMVMAGSTTRHSRLPNSDDLVSGGIIAAWLCTAATSALASLHSVGASHTLNAAADVDSSGGAAPLVFLLTSTSLPFFLWSVCGEDEQGSEGDTHATAASKAARLRAWRWKEQMWH